MNSTPKIHLPFYVKFFLIFIGMASLLAILFFGRPVIVPFIGATLVSVMLSPLVDFLTRKKINRTVAISLTLILGIIVILSLAFLLSMQVAGLRESMPQMKQNFLALTNEVKNWLSFNSGISGQKFDDLFHVKNFVNTENAAIGRTLVSMGNMLVLAVLVPVYIFLVLYYKPLLVGFVHRLFGVENDTMVSEVLATIKTTIKSYLVGLLLEALLVGTLYTTGLLIIGIEYAILLGVLAALLNIIPYVGQIIAGSLSMLMALATKSSPIYALIVLALFVFIQIIDNNFFLPKIVASKVKLNALVSIIVVIAGNLLWGVPGMFLAIPLTAICKVIFDEITPLKAWGFLLGDTMPSNGILNKKKKIDTKLSTRPK